MFSTFINCSNKSQLNTFKTLDDKSGKTINDSIKKIDDHIDDYYSNAKQLNELLRTTKDEKQRKSLEDAIDNLHHVIDKLKQKQDDLHHDAKKEKKDIKKANKDADHVGKRLQEIHEVKQERKEKFAAKVADIKAQQAAAAALLQTKAKGDGVGKATVSLTLSGTNKNAVAAARSKAAAKVTAQKTANYNKAYKARVATRIAGQCIKSMLSVIPPSFCYKKNADAGKIPTKCPVGWHRSGALCYEDCESGQTFVAGVCWGKCKSGWKDMGAICMQDCDKGFKDIGLLCERWHKMKLQSRQKKVDAKYSKIAKSITNFDSRVLCDDDTEELIYYKKGALCYRDCKVNGMINCGIGSCALSKKQCGAAIATMIVNIAMGFTQFVAFVASFGATSGDAAVNDAAKKEMQSALSKSTGKFDYALTYFKTIASNPIVRKAMMAKVKRMMLKWAALHAVTITVAQICQQAGDAIFDKVSSAKNVNFNVNMLDPTGISSAVESCKDPDNNSAKVTCAQSIINVASSLDPTGLVSIASALVQPVCDV